LPCVSHNEKGFRRINDLTRDWLLTFLLDLGVEVFVAREEDVVDLRA